MYKDFVLRVNPNYVLELLIQKEIISAKVSANVLNKETKADNCRALLDHLSSSSHRDAFIVLKKALVRYYPSIVTQIDTIDDSSIISKFLCACTILINDRHNYFQSKFI